MKHTSDSDQAHKGHRPVALEREVLGQIGVLYMLDCHSPLHTSDAEASLKPHPHPQRQNQGPTTPEA